jgi:hypothetical protein
MQTITWSPKLNNAIRAWKKNDVNNIANVSDKKNFLQYFGLSQEEQQAVNSIAIQKSGMVPQGMWN